MRKQGLLVNAAFVAFVLLVAACGEPAVDVALPARGDGQRVADLAGILDAGALEEQLAAASDATGLDIVALTFETPQASCGEAFRAGGAVVGAWEADIAVVAVARPGDFAAADEPRERCVGLRPADDYALPRALREDIAEVLVPPIAARNDWDGVFDAAVSRLAEDL